MYPTPPPDRILSITDFTRRVKGVLEGAFGEVWVRGEISNLRIQSSGHAYFSIKDAGSQVGAVMFRGDVARLETRLRDGMQIVAFGRVTVYEPRGNYQLVLRWVVQDGVGALQQRFEALKRKLAAEGLFDEARKRPLPAMPRTIGFVTSPTGAALRDFIGILRRRNWTGRLIVYPTRVQGSEAAAEIVAAIGAANRMGVCDLLVVGRGGGSLEDLWPFNEEIVVRAIVASAIPVISAVGHEIDFTLSDFAADFRAETPSGAAEAVTSRHVAVLERYERAARRFEERVELRMERMLNRVRMARMQLARHAPAQRLERGFLRVDDLTNRLQAVVNKRIGKSRERVHAAARRLLEASPRTRLSIARERVRQLRLRFDAASPERVLKRGYVMVRDAQGRVVSARAGIPTGTHLVNVFQDGELPVVAVVPPAQTQLPLDA